MKDRRDWRDAVGGSADAQLMPFIPKSQALAALSYFDLRDS